MIRQAHTYLVGALSGVVVIGIAIAAFVVLVSAQVFHDLPIPALSSSDQKAAAVSQGKALTGSSDQGAVASTGISQPDHATANANAAATNQAGATNAQAPAHHQASSATPNLSGTAPAGVVESAPSNNAGSGDHGSGPSGGSGGSQSSQPSSGSQGTSSGNNGSVGGGTATSTSGSGTSGSSSSSSSGSSGSTPTTGTSGGGSTATSPPPTPVTTAKPSEQVTEAVNGAVGTVDEALGGSLSESGVSKGIEEVVNGATGPESVVGKTVDEVGKVVNGLVNGSGE